MRFWIVCANFDGDCYDEIYYCKTHNLAFRYFTYLENLYPDVPIIIREDNIRERFIVD